MQELPYKRTDRVGQQIREILGQIALKHIDLSHLGFITFTGVNVSPDLRNAKVYLSVLGGSDIKTEALAGMQSAASFLRRELRNSISLRYVPFLKFELDQSLEDSTHLLNILDSLTIETEDHPYQQAPTNIEHQTN